MGDENNIYSLGNVPNSGLGFNLAPRVSTGLGTTGLGGTTPLGSDSGGGIFGLLAKLFDPGTKDAPGMGGITLGVTKGLADMFMGMKQYGLAKKQFNFQKQAYTNEYNNQARLLNADLESRQKGRIAASGDPNRHQSVDEYMRNYGVRTI